MAEQYPKTAVCQALNVKRSSLYYQPRRGEVPALKHSRRLCLFSVLRVSACDRRIASAALARQPQTDARLMAEMGVQAKRVVRKRRTTDSQHSFLRSPNLMQGRVVHYPDEVWVADITYVRLKHGFVYLAVLMDVCTRAIRGWHLGRTLEQTLTMDALLKALSTQHG